MKDYYDRHLCGLRLKRCYEVAPPRVVQYFEEELKFVLGHIPSGARVLELGCGYGRVLERLLERTDAVYGVDTALPGLHLARSSRDRERSSLVAAMNAARLGFGDASFDAVVCIQNGLSAFKETPLDLVQEAARVTRPGGLLLFSSYAETFWEDRLHWFRLQAAAGLLGPIDEARTGKGVIVCEDGFTARTVLPDEFETLASRITRDYRIVEVDRSSLFCVMRLPGQGKPPVPDLS